VLFNKRAASTGGGVRSGTTSGWCVGWQKLQRLRPRRAEACWCFSGEKQKAALLSDESAFRFGCLYQPIQPLSFLSLT
jgi:hypothetical protein